MGQRIPARAVIVASSTKSGEGGPDNGEATLFDNVLDLVGSTKWMHELDVTPADGMTKARALTEERRAVQSSAAFAEALRKNPKAMENHRANALSYAPQLVAGVRSGASDGSLLRSF